MKINPIKIKDLPKLMFFNKLNIDNLKYSDIKPGYIVHTIYDNYIWMVFDVKHLKNIYDKNFNILDITVSDLVLLHENSVSASQISYLPMTGYMNTFPKYKYDSDFNIDYVLETNIDIGRFKTKKSLLDFFDTYDTIIRKNMQS